MMKCRLFPMIFLLAACAQTAPPVVLDSATTPTETVVAEIKTETETATISPTAPQYDSIGAVVSLLNLPSDEAENETKRDATTSPVSEKNQAHAAQTPSSKTQPSAPMKTRVQAAPPAKKVNPKRPPAPKRLVAPKTNALPAVQTAVQENNNSPVANVAPKDAEEVPTLSEANISSARKNDLYAQAQVLFQKRKYQKVIEMLHHADAGGGSVAARKQMYLLLLSHQKLRNCQSVINIGQRLAGQFSGSQESAEALFMVGQCQWDIQQRDIAKETWRQLIASQPNTSASKRARLSLQQK